MKSIFASIKFLWLTDKLHFFVIAWFVLLYSWMYRVALRAIMDGSEFRWVNLLNTRMLGEERRALIGGNGMDGHFIIIAVLALFASALMFLIIRRPDTFTKAVFTGWILVFLTHQITVATQLGTDYVVRGDTIGMELPFYIIGPAQHLLMLVCALFWIRKDSMAALYIPPLDAERRKFLWRLLACYPVIFLLFRMGVQNGLTDVVGIILLYCQTFLLVFGLFSFTRNS